MSDFNCFAAHALDPSWVLWIAAAILAVAATAALVDGRRRPH
jgi:hypothetical protein